MPIDPYKGLILLQGSIGRSGEWAQTLVRASQEEVERLELSSCQLGDHHYCLVEAQSSQLRLGAPEPRHGLECSAKELAAKGKELLDSDTELGFATASDPAVTKPRRRSEKSVDSSSSNSSGSKDVGELLEKMQRSWLGKDTSSGQPRGGADADPSKHGRRFSLIHKQKSEKKEKDGDAAYHTLLDKVASSKDPLQGLLALQIAQNLGAKDKSKKKSRKSSKSSSSSTSSGSSSGTDSISSRKPSGHAKAVENMRAKKKRMFRKPLHYVRRYVKNIQEEMGAEDKPFRVVDYTRRIGFGKQRNLQKCHYLFGIVLEMLLKEEFSKAALQVTLCLQALHQAAIDSDWQIAWLLTHVPDPFERKIWGGDADSLQHVTAYVRSMHELARNTDNLRKKGTGKQGEETESLGGKSKTKGKGNKNKDKEEGDA